MATEAAFNVGPEEFPLGTIFEQMSSATVELERIVPGNGVVIPYFWVRGVDVEDIEAAVSDHPGVRAILLVDSVAEEYLLRVEWDPAYEGILSTLAETHVPLISAVRTNNRWTFDIRGDDRSDVAAFQRRCRERDIPITLTALHALLRSRRRPNRLSRAQQEALVLAYERGYFDSPRESRSKKLERNLESASRPLPLDSVAESVGFSAGRSPRWRSDATSI